MPKDYFPDLSVVHKIYGSDILLRKYVGFQFPWVRGSDEYKDVRAIVSDEKAGDPNRLENILHRTLFSQCDCLRYTGPENESLSFSLPG